MTAGFTRCVSICPYSMRHISYSCGYSSYSRRHSLNRLFPTVLVFVSAFLLLLDRCTVMFFYPHFLLDRYTVFHIYNKKSNLLVSLISRISVLATHPQVSSAVYAHSIYADFFNAIVNQTQAGTGSPRFASSLLCCSSRGNYCSSLSYVTILKFH